MTEELNDDAGLSPEAKAWLLTHDITTIAQLTQHSEQSLSELDDYDISHLWDIEDALDARGLSLQPNSDYLEQLGVLPIYEWVDRLAEICPHAKDLKVDEVRAALQNQGWEVAEWDEPKPPSQFKPVLCVLASRQPEWLYYSDWKGSREAAARTFERWLKLPTGHLSPELDTPLSFVASDANRAAKELGTTEERIADIPPYEDDCLFVLHSPELWDALIAARVLAATSIEDYETRGEPGLTFAAETALHDIDAFADDALNLFENIPLRTVGELVGLSAHELRKHKSRTGVVEHIQDVLRRADMRLR